MTREQVKARAIPLLESMLDLLMDNVGLTDDQKRTLAGPYEDWIRDLASNFNPETK